jgi:predicted P-loop ATPase
MSLPNINTYGVANSQLVWTRQKVPRIADEVANAITIFTNDSRWSDVFAYDERAEEIVKRRPAPWHDDDSECEATAGPLSDSDLTRASAWLQREYRIDLSFDKVVAAIRVVAERSRFDPVRDYLRSLVWDGQPRFDGWLPHYTGAEDNAYVRAVGARWLLSVVARAHLPGCKVDCVLILEGEQGSRKSTVARTMALRDEWFYDSDIAIGEKEGPLALRGKMIAEFPELADLSRYESNRMKGFISRQSDCYRSPYARRAFDHPRRWVGIGTTNSTTYLRDESGNRRWWPVRTGTILADELRRDVEQLYAEAVVRFDAGAVWHVDSPEFAEACTYEQEDRVVQDPWDTTIHDYLVNKIRQVKSDGGSFRMPAVSTGEILGQALAIEPRYWSKGDATRLGPFLKRFGWVHGPRTENEGVRTRTYVPSAKAVAEALHDLPERRGEALSTMRDAAREEWDARTVEVEAGDVAAAIEFPPVTPATAVSQQALPLR